MAKSRDKSVWDERYGNRTMVSPLDFTKKAWSFMEGMHEPAVLDVGCGDGRDSLYFAEHGCRVTAVDFSEEAIKRVRNLHHPMIAVQVMDIIAMDFPDASFDVVFAHLSLHYFDDAVTDAIFTNIHRILRPEGFFFVKCKSVDDPLFGQGEKVGENIFRLEYVRHFFSEGYMREKLRTFTILNLESSRSTYDGKESAFVEAVTRKSSSSAT